MADIPDEIVDRAERIRTGLSQSIDAVKANMDLTPDGAQRQLDEAHDRARQSMDELRNEWKAKSAKIVESATRDIFGSSFTTGVDAISIRDAEDRASRLERADEAKELLSQAGRNGDKALERAVALEAMRRSDQTLFGHSWRKVLEEYLVDRPIAAKRFEDLQANKPGDFTENFQNGFVFLLPSKSGF